MPIDDQDREILISHIIQSGYMTENEWEFIHPSEAFRNFEVKILLSDLEKKRNILIPGHRFLPLLTGSNNPWDSSLTDEKSRFEIPVKEERFLWGELKIFFSLFDGESVMRYLGMSNSGNMNRFMESGGDPQTEIVLTVFDLAPWWNALKSAPGAGLMIRHRGEYKMDFSVKALSQSEINLTDHSQKVNFIQTLDSGFDEITRVYGANLHAEDQIALNYFRNRTVCGQNPPLHFGGYLAESDRFGLVGFSGNAVIWPKESVLPPELETEIGELDEMLMELDIAFTEGEIEAFIRDEFFSGKPDKIRFLDRCFGNREMDFLDEEEELRFNSLIDELWQEVEDSYSPETDTLAGPLRHRILKLQADQLQFIRGLDVTEAELEAVGEPLETLSQVSGFLGSILDMLNLDDLEENNSGREFNELTVLLGNIENDQSEMFRDIEQALLQFISPKKTVKRRKSKAEIYQFKITLKGSKPPIWRRIAIPGNFTLGDLHSAIQIAMGWYNSHLHEFTIKGMRYDDPELRDGFDMWGEPARSELTAKLQILNLREGMSFTYVYDFGDDWNHSIKVEKILPRSEYSGDPSQNVVCLKAKNACPPEDCGGIYGYYDMIDVLGDPDDPEFEETAEWLGDGFNPELVDLKEINRELSDKFG